MNTYEVRYSNGDHITFEAEDEQSARLIAMLNRYGDWPDRITPHAPKYRGRGLTVNLVKPT